MRAKVGKYKLRAGAGKNKLKAGGFFHLLCELVKRLSQATHNTQNLRQQWLFPDNISNKHDIWYPDVNLDVSDYNKSDVSDYNN